MRILPLLNYVLNLPLDRQPWALGRREEVEEKLQRLEVMEKVKVMEKVMVTVKVTGRQLVQGKVHLQVQGKV
jgi:hypothetical protein